MKHCDECDLSLLIDRLALVEEKAEALVKSWDEFSDGTKEMNELRAALQPAQEKGKNDGA